MKIVMNSGAPCNLLAREVFDVMSGNDGCRLLKTSNRISCANDTIELPRRDEPTFFVNWDDNASEVSCD